MKVKFEGGTGTYCLALAFWQNNSSSTSMMNKTNCMEINPSSERKYLTKNFHKSNGSAILTVPK
ncbi:hypothetical protein BLOT_008957 [Blomia tropicalis]|nr:hypothetical protein BLOT_008957 [Blomia tropicalis]